MTTNTATATATANRSVDVAMYKIWPEAESCVDRLIEVIEAQGVKSVGPGTKGYV